MKDTLTERVGFYLPKHLLKAFNVTDSKLIRKLVLNMLADEQFIAKVSKDNKEKHNFVVRLSEKTANLLNDVTTYTNMKKSELLTKYLEYIGVGNDE